MLAAPTASVHQLVPSRLPSRSQSCEKNLPLPAATPNSFGSLADRDRQPEAEQEAGHHRLRDEVDDAAEPQRARDGEHDAGDDRERRRERREPRRVAVGERPDAAADSADVAVVALTTSVREVPSHA